MSRFILVRVVIGFCLLLVLSTVTFAIYASIPVEPAGFLVDLQHATPAQIAAAHQALGLDHSI
jgi:ABC-type dipeptide/oligopeptide/nickel transport system permease component